MPGTNPNPTTEEIESIKNLYNRKFPNLKNYPIDDAHWLTITKNILAHKKKISSAPMLLHVLFLVTGENWNNKLQISNPGREARRASDNYDVDEASDTHDNMTVKRTRYDALLAPSTLFLRENTSTTTVPIEDAQLPNSARERCKTPIQAMLEPFGVQTVTLTSPPRPTNQPVKTWDSPKGSQYRLFRESADHKDGALYEKVSPKKNPVSMLPSDLAAEKLSRIWDHYKQTEMQATSINKEGIQSAAERRRPCSQQTLTGFRCQEVFEAENCTELLSGPKSKAHWAHLIGHGLDATGQHHHAGSLIPATSESNLRTLGAFEQPIRAQLLSSSALKKVDMTAVPVYSGDSLIPHSVKTSLDWHYELEDGVGPVKLSEVIHINPRSTKHPNSNDFKAINALRHSELKMKSCRRVFDSDNLDDESIRGSSSFELLSEQFPIDVDEFIPSQSSSGLSSVFFNLSSTNSSGISTPARTDTPGRSSHRCSSQLDSSQFAGSQLDEEYDNATSAPGSQIE